MKKVLAMLLALVMVVGLVACAPSDPTTTAGNGNGTTAGAVDYNTVLAGDYGEITMWVSETDGVKEQFQEQVAAFQKLYPNVKFSVKIDGVSEADAASQVIADVASAPDIYCFAQDQLTRLVQAAALTAPTGTLIDTIKAENSAAAVSAASVAGQIWAYPLTADNGYYMYYNTSLFSAEDVEDLATLAKKCEENGVKFRFALENAWYTASFFYATGCTSTWSMNTEGKWTGVEDNWNSDKGLIAMKGMQILTSSTAYDSNADIFTDAGVIVTGTWNAKAAADHFGDNLGATDLPSFTVDGNTYHLNSYFGCKLMGVKPQSDAKKGILLQLLAQYLTNKDNQLARFNAFEWGPSNIEAQADNAVKSNISLLALTKQNEYAVTQGNINGSWWDIAKLLGAEAKAAKTEQDLKDALKEYEDAIKAVLTKSDEELKAWGVIGGICGTSWDTDFPMTKQDDGSYLSNVLTLNAGEEFKVRQGGSWDVNYGANGEFNAGSNLVVETTGKYQVKLTIVEEGKLANIELIPAE